MDVPYFPNEDFMHVLHERPLRPLTKFMPILPLGKQTGK